MTNTRFNALKADAHWQRVWDELVDWPRQDLWIPLTKVRVTGSRSEGLGTRVAALSGFRLGPVPVGLLATAILMPMATDLLV